MLQNNLGIVSKTRELFHAHHLHFHGIEGFFDRGPCHHFHADTCIGLYPRAVCGERRHGHHRPLDGLGRGHLKSNMWVLPRGMKRDGMGGKNSIAWESKYGSLIVSGYDIGTSEGMNEMGLVVNMLALVESDYGKPPEGTKVISMSTWAQYILDNHATVAEAVADFRKGDFQVQTVVLPTGKPANMHLSMADPTGDSAIFEYVQGKLVIHHGKQFKVMTNSPTYDQQLAIMEYWRLAGGLTKSLPGTSNAADRFVRATFLLEAIPTEAKPQYISGVAGEKFHFQAMMSVLSVMRSVGTPLGIDVENNPWVGP